MGGGSPRPRTKVVAASSSHPLSHQRRRAPPNPLATPPPPLLHPPPSFLRPPPVIPAQAGTTSRARQPTPTPPPPNLPPERGEVRWGVEARDHAQSLLRPAPVIHAATSAGAHQTPPATPPPSFLRPPPSFLRRQEPRRAPANPPPNPFPNSSLPPLRGEVRWGVEARDRARSLLRPISSRPPSRWSCRAHPPKRKTRGRMSLCPLLSHTCGHSR